MKMLYILIIAIFLQIADTLLTQVSLNLGVEELNPMYGKNPDVYRLFTIKGLICGLLIFIYNAKSDTSCLFNILNTIMMGVVLFSLINLVMIT